MSSLALARLGSLSRATCNAAASASGATSGAASANPGGVGPAMASPVGGSPHWTLRDAGAGQRWPSARATASSAGSAKSSESVARRLVAVGQMTSVGDKHENFATCERLAKVTSASLLVPQTWNRGALGPSLIERRTPATGGRDNLVGELPVTVCKEASAAGCLALFLPECFSFIGSSWMESLDAAEPLDGPTMKRYQQLARDNNLWLSLGGFQQSNSEDSSKLLNTHVMVDDKGNIVEHYAKVHLFNVDVPNGPVLMESRFTSPGNRLAVCDSPVGRVGLTVCYDLRFPEIYQKLVHHHGATILTVPSAFTKPTGEAHWEVLLRARAIETQSYVIAAAQAGWHNEKRQSYGHSLIVDPWGSVVARLDDPLETGIAVAEIDAANMEQIRARMPIKEHRAAGLAALGDSHDSQRG